MRGHLRSRKDPPRSGRKKKQAKSNIEVESQSDSKIVASSKRRVSPSRTHFGVDLWETLNAKRSRCGDLRAKLLAKIATPVKHVIPKKSITRTAWSVPREHIPMYQTPFMPEIEGWTLSKSSLLQSSLCIMKSQTRGLTSVISNKWWCYNIILMHGCFH